MYHPTSNNVPSHKQLRFAQLLVTYFATKPAYKPSENLESIAVNSDSTP